MRRAVAVLIILLIVLGSVAVIGFYLVKDNVTVSGMANVTYVPGTIIQSIEFVDTQGGVLTTFQFPQDYNSAGGNYSVTLKNGHTYNVYISFCVIDPKDSQSHFTTVFHVNAADGQTAITKDFWYPNYT
jgi:hypothetical protein